MTVLVTGATGSDVARGHILAAQKGAFGERYILGNLNCSLTEICGVGVWS
jgi:nucleoside-diphosphate-sugar epimerase